MQKASRASHGISGRKAGVRAVSEPGKVQYAALEYCH